MERTLLASALADPFFAEALFDQLHDVVFFVKDLAGRYVVVNTTLMRRCGRASKQEMIGRGPLDVFPHELGAGYAAQDAAVLASGQPLHNRLELHLYPGRMAGWCRTHKIPLRDAGRQVVGLAGISKDLRSPDQGDPVYQRIAAAVQFLQEHYAEPVRLGAVAAMSGLSLSQFERQIERMFDLTPKQLLTKMRIDAAMALLAHHGSVADIALACGYADHSAFSRQFKTVVGVSPSEYRSLGR